MGNKIKGIITREEFAKAFDIPLKNLTYVLYILNTDSLYKSFTISKKYGGERKISAPINELKDIQRKIYKKLYVYFYTELNYKSNIAHAFIKGKSFITNAEIHKNKKWVLNIDLEDFFPSINFGRVKGFFEKNSDFLYSKDVAIIMAQLTCYKGCLPQGAKTSPILANMITSILDSRLLRIAKKYKCDYTRYADDLTFSSNYSGFLEQKDLLLEELRKVIERSGFKINNKKTNLQNKESRQVVTGVVVNKKLNINLKYYRQNRAMIETLYRGKDFFIDGEIGTIAKLEGRFSFVNQVVNYNNKKDKTGTKHNFNVLNARERQYQKFLVYKYFLNNTKPLIVTEGKTDIIYLKAALMNLADKFPNLVSKKQNGEFVFKIKFLKRTKRLEYFLNISKDGASALKSIYRFYTGENKYINYFEKFTKNCMSQFPVILLFDNETIGDKKPLKDFIKSMSKNKEKLKEIEIKLKAKLVERSNLYLLTHKLEEGKKESEIEDLFDSETLAIQKDGKTFNRNTNRDNNDKFFGKEVFAKHILENYETINFNGFIPLLQDMDSIVVETAKIHKEFLEGKENI